jgi:alpha-tubulin suppressor-like RCC1 family protein
MGTWSSKTWPSVPCPFLFQIPAFETQMAVAVAAGQDFSVALDSQGEVYSWGSAGRGQLGQGRCVYGEETYDNLKSSSNMTAIVAVILSLYTLLPCFCLQRGR